jgi:UDP:flavonoid glycosyltransferase YjiC (YdhE family)
MKVFIACVGTIGDLNPYISVGTVLAARGHDVTLMSDASKQAVIERAGLGFGEVLSRSRWEHSISQPALWARDTSLQTAFQYWCLPTILPMYRYVLANHEPNNTLLIGVPGAIGVKFAQEKLGLPLIHLYLNPYQARRETSAAQSEDERQLRTLFNQLRGLVGLPPIEAPLQEWLCSADRRIAAFPRWYGAAKANTVDLTYVDFIFSDEVAHQDGGDALDAFLARGDRPIVFTAGTGARHVEDFFAAAVDACERLAARAILLATSAGQVPRHLPESAFHSTYAPLGQLLPSVDGIVHHGGIGTCAQALRAGVFQLLKPLAFDQFDNAERLGALGVGRTIADSRINGPDLAEEIQRLRQCPDVRHSCADVSRRLHGADARVAIADLIETVM